MLTDIPPKQKICLFAIMSMLGVQAIDAQGNDNVVVINDLVLGLVNNRNGNHNSKGVNCF